LGDLARHLRGVFIVRHGIAAHGMGIRAKPDHSQQDPHRIFLSVVFCRAAHRQLLARDGLILPVVFLVLLGSVINRQLTVDLLTAD
jgi:hypothetical protein